MSIQSILTKTTLACILVLFFTPVNPVYAQKADLVSTHLLNLDIEQNGDIKVSHSIELANNAEPIVTSYRLRPPFPSITDARVKINGQKVPTKFQNGKFYLNFSRPVQQGGRVKIAVSYTAKNVISEDYGLVALEVPPLQGPERVTGFNVLVNYPQDYPRLLHVSDRRAEIADNSVKLFNGQSGIYLLWGEQRVFSISESLDIESQTGEVSLVNLLPSNADQQVAYTDIHPLVDVSTQTNGNSWAVVQDQSQLQIDANVTLSAAAGVSSSSEIPAAGLTDRIEGVNSPQFTNVQKLEKIYDFLVHNLNPTIESGTIDLSNTPADFEVGKREFNSAQYSYLLAAMLADLNISSTIKYGYVLNLEYSDFNSNLPHAWVDVSLGDKTYVLDPYLESITGQNFFDTTNANRLMYGSWQPGFGQDNMLGLLVGKNRFRTRPQISSVQELNAKADIDLALQVPSRIQSFEMYDAYLTITNSSPYIIPINNVTWDNQDVSEILHIIPNSNRAVPPNSTVTLAINNLLQLNPLTDGEHNHVLGITYEHPLFAHDSVVEGIFYVPNLQILAILAIALTLTTIGGSIWYWRQSRLLN